MWFRIMQVVRLKLENLTSYLIMLFKLSKNNRSGPREHILTVMAIT